MDGESAEDQPAQDVLADAAAQKARRAIPTRRQAKPSPRAPLSLPCVPAPALQPNPARARP